VLDGDDTARGEAGAVARAVDLVKNWNLGIARAQKLGMEGMADAALHRAQGRDQRLTEHLTAENALHPVFGRNPAEYVLFDLLQIEEIEDFFDGRFVGLRHGAALEAQMLQRKTSKSCHKIRSKALPEDYDPS
jgi:hypothetical protein